LLDPVQKLRISQPEALIDTDFEYGIQSTKWEAIELVNNIPTFYNRTGDDSITLLDVTVTSGSNLVTVETSINHDFVIGSPFIINGLTISEAEGTFFVLSITSSTKFVYRSKNTLSVTGSIYDRFSSYLYPARMYQGTQYNIDNITSIETNNESPSNLIVTTKSPNGFTEGTTFTLVNSNGLKEVQFDGTLVDVVNSYTLDLSINTIGVNNSLTGFRERNVNPYDWESKKTLFFDQNNITGNNITITGHGLTGTQNYLMYVPPVNDTPIGGLTPYNLYLANVVNSNQISLKQVVPSYSPGLYWSRMAGYWNGTLTYFLTTAVAASDYTLPYTLSTNVAGIAINTSAEFIGYFRPHVTGNWQFIINSEDKAYLWIGDAALNPSGIPSGTDGTNINTDSAAYRDSTATSAISLVAGQYYPIRIMYGLANVASSNNIVTLKFIFPGQASYVSSVSGQQFLFHNAAQLSEGLFWGRRSGYWNGTLSYFTQLNLVALGYSSVSTISTNVSGVAINTSTEFIGYFRPHVSGNWTFIINAEDKAYFWIGNAALTASSIPSGTNGTNINTDSTAYRDSPATSAISLTAGEYYPIRIMYGLANVASSNNIATLKFTYPGQASYVTSVAGQELFFNTGYTYNLDYSTVTLSAGGTNVYGEHALLKAHPIMSVSTAGTFNIKTLMNTANFIDATMPGNTPIALFSDVAGSKGFIFESKNSSNARVLLRSTNNVSTSNYKKCFIKSPITVGSFTTNVDIAETLGGSQVITTIPRTFGASWIVPLEIFMEYDSFYYPSHGYSENDVVTYSVLSGSGPTGITNGTQYKIGRVTSNWFRLKTNVASPLLIDIQSLGNGVISFQKTFTNPNKDTIYSPNHNLVNGTLITYNNNGNSSIGPLTNGGTYWVYNSTPTRFALSSTDPLSSTTHVDLLTTSSGTHSVIATGRGVLDDNYTIVNVSNNKTFALECPNKVPYRVLDIYPNKNIDLSSSYVYYVNHGITTGTRLIYQNNGNTDIGGLSGNTSYYAIRIDLDRFRVAASYDDAILGTFIPITSLGTGTNHYFQNTSILGETSIASSIILTNENTVVDASSNLGVDFLSYYKVGDNIHIEIPLATVTTITATSIDINTEVLTTGAAHGLTTGTALLYSGATSLGLTQGFIYYVDIAGLTATQFKLHTTYSSALQSGAALVNFTATGTPAFTKIATKMIFSSKIAEINSKTRVTLTVAPTTTTLLGNLIITTSMFPRADGIVAHRAFDGGVEMLASTNANAQLIRQTRRYFRYQSGKGLQMSEAVNFTGIFSLEDLSREGFIVTARSRKNHRMSIGTLVTITNAEPSSWNGRYEVLSIPSSTEFTFDIRNKIINNQLPYIYSPENVPTGTTATGFPSFTVKNWTNCTIKVGMFDDQNGLFFEYDGSDLYCVRRNSTKQISGTSKVRFNNAQITGINTKFLTQLNINEFIAIRGQSYKVVEIDSDTDIYVQPPYRGVDSDTAIISKIIDYKVKQGEWSIDNCDGTGSSGYNLDVTKGQMIFIDYAWYGLGKVRFGFRTVRGEIVYVHEIIHNNFNEEAYLRSGNLPGRYEIINTGKPSYVPGLMHWGTSVIMDGRFDSDKAYLFTAPGNQMTFNGATLLDFSGNVVNRFNTYSVWNGSTYQRSYLILATNKQSTVLNIKPSTLLVGSNLQSGTRTVGNTVYVNSTQTNVYIDRQPTSNLSNVSYTIGTSSVDYPLTAGIPLISLRLSPSVDNGRQGSLGAREIINRMQLTLDSIGILSTHDVEIRLLLNGFPTSKTWSQVTQPSLSQILLHNKNDTVIGGTPVYNFRVSGGSADSTGKRSSNNVTVNLNELATLGNSIIGGDGVFPDGPDILTVVAFYVDNLSDITSAKPFTITGRVTWTESQA
jgi:hypothetical protein